MSKSENNNPTKFGLKKLLLILAALTIPIIGPILVIRSKRFKKPGKIIAGIWLALMVIAVFIPTDNNEEQNINIAQEETQEIQDQYESAVIDNNQINESSNENNPEQNKQLKVNIKENYEINNKGELIYKANTNLPENLDIMFSLEAKNEDYFAQSQGKVRQNGYIESNPFSNNGSPLKSGNYIINISSPKPSIQSDNVKEIIGENGENLSGDFISNGMLDFKKEFYLNNQYDIDYFIAEKEDISMPGANRYNWNVVINEPVTPEQMKFISKEIIQKAKQNLDFNALTLMFYDYEEYIGHGYTLGKTTYAPDGEWAKANTVNPGDYSSMEYLFELRNKDWDLQLTKEEVKIWSEIRKEYSMAYENTESTEIIDEDKIHQKVANTFNISKEKVSETHMKKVTWDFNNISDD